MWLIKQETAAEIARLHRTVPSPTAEQRTAFRAETQVEPTARESRNMKVAGSVAEIGVRGVLVKQPSFLMWLMGIEQTAYSDIATALASASADASIKSVVMRVDSPGGQVDGLFECLAAVQAFDKPLSVLATQACSAAYALAAVAGKITATGPAASFGSIGVAASIGLDKETVDLTSTAAPNKRPDVTTEEGKAVVVEYLDAIHALFADAIADGRDTTVAAVNSGFGRGAVVLAADARSRGMIDGVVKPARTDSKRSKVGASADAEEMEIVTMDLRTLKAQHPDVYDAAVAEGVTAERDRVSAHLTLGATGGDEGMAVAMTAIEAGTGLNMTTQAKYTALALNRRDRDLRQTDDKGAQNAADNATAPKTQQNVDPDAEPTPTAENIGDIVAARMMAKRGKKVA
jgi:ClpP class serine protease